jgi:uncharacterized protein with NRDE domain
MKNPWLRPAPEYYSIEVKEIQAVSVEDRKTELKTFDIAKLKAVIAWPGTQKAVRLAAERRVRKKEVYKRTKKKKRSQICQGYVNYAITNNQ